MRRVLLSLACAGALSAGAARAASPPPIEAYGAFDAISDVSLSPSGKHAAFMVTNAKGRLIAVQDVGGKVIATVTPGAVKLRGLNWAGDDFLEVTTSVTLNISSDFGSKDELSRVDVLNLHTLKVATVFAGQKTVAVPVLGNYGSAQIGGRWYGFFSGFPMKSEAAGFDSSITGDAQLYKVDLQTGQTNPVAVTGSHSFNWALAPDGTIVAHSDYNQISGEWQLAPGPGPGGKPLFSTKTPLNDLSLLGLGRTPGSVLIRDQSGSEDRYEEVSLTTGAITPLLEGYNVKELIWDNVTDLFLGAEVRGPEGAVLFDQKLQARVRGAFKAFPGRHVELESYDPPFDDLIVKTDGADDSGTFWFVDIAKGTAVPLGGARPGVPQEMVGPTRLFAYKAADGLAMEGVLTLPAGRDPKSLPLVVMPHGGPLGERDEVGFDWWAQAFASRGYAVFQPNYRGSGGYGLAFQKAGYGEWGRKMLSDMADGVGALAAEGIVDPKRACIVGASYGGYAALAGVTLQHGLYRCAVSYAGVSDLPSLRRFQVLRQGDNNAMVRNWKTAVEGDAKGAPGLDQISPARFAASASAPVLLMHGKDDTVVPIDQSREMASALKGAGKPVTLVEFTGQDHWLSDEQSRIQILKASLDFVQTNNPAN